MTTRTYIVWHEREDGTTVIERVQHHTVPRDATRHVARSSTLLDAVARAAEHGVRHGYAVEA